MLTRWEGKREGGGNQGEREGHRQKQYVYRETGTRRERGEKGDEERERERERGREGGREREREREE